MRRNGAFRMTARLITVAATAAGLLVLDGIALAQVSGPVGVGKAERTDDGRWQGTWIYQARDTEMALWLREDQNGVPELKLRYDSKVPREAFETDWGGKAEYSVQGAPGSFEIRVSERDRNVIKGEWIWDVESEDWARGQHGTFTMYRVLDGRRMVIDFERFEQYRRKGDKEQRREGESAWAFEKASKRLVRWEELPL